MMSSKQIIFIVCIFSIIGVIGIYLFTGKTAPGPTSSIDNNGRQAAAPASSHEVVHLYFADKDSGFLVAEKRSLALQTDLNEFGKAVCDALIAGPQTNLLRTLPVKTACRAFYVTPDRTAFVDFSSSIRDDHPGGIKSELISVYSIVNTLTLNSPEIDAVKILVQGREAPTLAGHIALQSPFKANMLLIR